MDELTDRFVHAAGFAERIQEMKERLDLIRDLVAEVNAGSLAPLKALADIEAALDL